MYRHLQKCLYKGLCPKLSTNTTNSTPSLDNSESESLFMAKLLPYSQWVQGQISWLIYGNSCSKTINSQLTNSQSHA